MRFTIDSNVLVYAADVATPEKHHVARSLLERAMPADVLLTAQVLGEFLNVIGRKLPAKLHEAREQAERWMKLVAVADTSARHVLAATDFARRHRLQYWDSLIWTVAQSAGATFFVSEDLQDGLSIGGMTVLDPFNRNNDEVLDRLLADASAGG